MNRDQILGLKRSQLAALLARGHAIDERALDDSQYRGVSLGLGRVIEALTWKTFGKTFHRDPESGRLRGWNLRLQQTGIDGPAIPLRRFGHYRVSTLKKTPRPCGPGLLIEYPSLVRDPIVAVNPGSVELLLGWTYLELGKLQLPTPSYFLLIREGALTV
jgi:hypothetical protein